MLLMIALKSLYKISWLFPPKVSEAMLIELRNLQFCSLQVL